MQATANGAVVERRQPGGPPRLQSRSPEAGGRPAPAGRTEAGGARPPEVARRQPGGRRRTQPCPDAGGSPATAGRSLLLLLEPGDSRATFRV